MRHHPKPRSVVIALLAAAVLLVGLATPAAGQATTSDPYGSTVPPTEPPGDPTCSVDSAVGASVSGSIAGLAAGTEVDLVLGGQVLATLVANADGVIDFSVDVGELVGVLVAVGVTFNIECDDPGAVLGETEERPQTGGGTDVLGSGTDNGGSGSGSGALARTGATIIPLIVLALIALAVGAYLRKRSRGRATPVLG